MKAKKAHIRLVDNATICYVDTAVSNASFSRYGHESLAEVAAHSAKVEHFTLLIFNLSSIRIEISWIGKDKREREREREKGEGDVKQLGETRLVSCWLRTSLEGGMWKRTIRADDALFEKSKVPSPHCQNWRFNWRLEKRGRGWERERKKERGWKISKEIFLRVPLRPINNVGGQRQAKWLDVVFAITSDLWEVNDFSE